jgi:predicted Zn-ribbon and HTH transcriptional regulator
MRRYPARLRPRDLPERQTTVRAELRAILRERLLTAREISARIAIGEKDVAEHLQHLSRSVKPGGERLQIEHAWCHACGFVFRDRERFSKPSRCPRCKEQRLAPARYRVVPVGGGSSAESERDDT